MPAQKICGRLFLVIHYNNNYKNNDDYQSDGYAVFHNETLPLLVIHTIPKISGSITICKKRCNMTNVMSFC